MTLNRGDPEVDRLIIKYWRRGKTYASILAFLKQVHRVAVGMTWLKRRLLQLGLRKRGVAYTSISAVKRAIQMELRTSNCLLGYRSMWRLIMEKYGYRVKRETVMMLLAVLDPIGVQLRRAKRLRRRSYYNKGPNWVWHLDGYDKLKPFGFPIHGCIDGYSRRIMWLELTPTNNDPEVVCQFYLRTVLEVEGCPTLVRSDHGTENTALASCQMTLRHGHLDEFSGHRSYRFGASTTNTRIEGWWSQLRRLKTQWWIELFKDLTERGLYDPNNTVHRHCAGYVYGPLLRHDLKEFAMFWNNHRIRRNRLAGCPPGIPDDLYHLAGHQGLGQDHKKPVDPSLLAYLMHKNSKAPEFYPSEFKALADSVLSGAQLEQSDITVENAEQVYCLLLNVIGNV